MGSEPRRCICERCGGSGQQGEWLWNTATEKYDAPAGVCDGCKGSGYLGVIEQPIDLDALAAILRRNDAARIKDAWEHFGPLIERCKRAEDNYWLIHGLLKVATEKYDDMAERCKESDELVSRYAKQIIGLDDQVSDLTRQRDELLSACVEGGAVLNALWIAERTGPALCKQMKGAIKGALAVIDPLIAKHSEHYEQIAGVKGGTDGT